jgi:hypothetical protein
MIEHVFGGMGLALVNDLAAIGAVLQDQVERTAREWLAANDPVESECDAGGFRSTLSVAAPFVWRCLTCIS